MENIEINDTCCNIGHMKTLDQAYWDTQYQNNETGWDMGMVSPPLKEYIDQIQNKDLRILIPGCGNTYEADYLLNKGFTDITVVDIAPTLVANLKEKYKLNKHIQIVLANFFQIEGVYDLVIEQTFFCALTPILRTDYKNKMMEILAPQGKLVGLLFNKEFEKEGPPFGGTQAEYELLFKDSFEFETIADCYNSHPKRAGNELFIIFKKKVAV